MAPGGERAVGSRVLQKHSSKAVQTQSGKGEAGEEGRAVLQHVTFVGTEDTNPLPSHREAC